MSGDKQIDEMPERNVKMFASKEEYEHYCIKLIERDVAEEIFAEIEKKIDLELSIIQKIIHAKGGRANGKTVLLGKIQTLIDSKNFIAELKKKYIGEDTNVTTNTEEGK